jgi:hypothetical protein
MKQMATIMVLLFSIFITLNAKDITKEATSESNSTWKVTERGELCKSKIKCNKSDCNSSEKAKCTKKDCVGGNSHCKKKECDIKDCNGTNCKSEKNSENPTMKCGNKKCTGDKVPNNSKQTKCTKKDCKIKDCDGANCKSNDMPKHPGMKCASGKCGTDK